MNWTDYIKPELAALPFVLYFIGWAFKKVERCKDALIPFILMGAGMTLAALWVFAWSPISCWQDGMLAAFTAIVQGLLCAGAAVLANQSIKQGHELTDKAADE